MTRFAACFLTVFGQLAFGGMLGLAVPPFFKVERGFYKSTAGVYLSSALITAAGFALLALRANPSHHPAPYVLWISAAVWTAFAAVSAAYLVTLWSDNGWRRARSYASALAVGLIAVVLTSVPMRQPDFGATAAVFYALTAVTSSMVLGLVSGAMMFGHWYLIDPNLPVDYLRDFVRLLGQALVLDIAVMMLVPPCLWLAGGAARTAIVTLVDSHWLLLAARMILGPVATLILTWMTWQTLKVPQTMAATGLLYIAVMAALVGEMLGRFILFRTAVPL